MGETKMAWVEILVWVTWVDEVLASMKFWRVLKFWCRLQGSMKYYHGSKKKFLLPFFFVICKCSLFLFVPDIRLFVCPMFISYLNSNYASYKLKWAFFDRFPYSFPEAYLEPKNNSIVDVRQGSN